jgi:hypothetical protein
MLRRNLTKRSDDQFDILIKDIQADPKRLRLLQILGEQVQLLIEDGKPDLHSLLDSLKKESLMSQKDHNGLAAHYALDTVRAHSKQQNADALT